MKKIVYLIIFISAQVGAQEIVKETPIYTGEESPASERLNKKQVSEGWYHFISSGADAGISWTRITNATLFPDTLVLQRYGGGTSATLGRVQSHSVGQIFDPKDFLFTTPPAYSKFNGYTWDSLAVMFRYSHNIPGTVDTLLINFYAGKNITRTTLQGSGRKVATVAYNKSANMGTGYVSQIKVPITVDDTTDFANTADYNIKVIALPIPLKIGPDSLCGYTMSFIPGYSYADGDTLQQDWEVPPVKKLNHLVYASWRDNSKLFNNAYNGGLRATRESRYTSDVWNNLYIPGHAWNDYDEMVNSYFYVKTLNFKVNDLTQSFKIYPNPVKSGERMILPEALSLSAYQILDLSGKVISEGIAHDTQIEAQLKAGVYILSAYKDQQHYSTRILVTE